MKKISLALVALLSCARVFAHGDHDPSQGHGKPPPLAVLQLDEVRTQGLSRAVDALLPGISAMAAPVFDERGEIALSLTAIGPSAVFDTRFDGAVATALRQSAADLSRRLGAR